MSAPSALPQRTRTYQNHHLDSTRWNYFTQRPGDIVISTSYKAGTTWTQNIVGQLLFPNGELPFPPIALSPWLDLRTQPLENVLNQLEAQQTRRFIKTHLPLDALPFRTDVKYVVVSRDARDVFMSLMNHWGSHTDFAYDNMNGVPGRVGEPMPRFVDDVGARWRDWTTRASFAWEQDGYPYWSHFEHLRSWWPWRHLPNVRLVHYADLLRDLEGEMRALAAFLGTEVPEARWPVLVEACRFESMRETAINTIDGAMKVMFKDGARTFFNKGTNGRWRDVLTADDMKLYETAVDRVLGADARRWMEEGGSTAGG